METLYRTIHRYAKEWSANPVFEETRESSTRTYKHPVEFKEFGKVLIDGGNGYYLVEWPDGRLSVASPVNNSGLVNIYKYVDSKESACREFDEIDFRRDYDRQVRTIFRDYQAALKELDRTHPFKTGVK